MLIVAQATQAKNNMKITLIEKLRVNGNLLNTKKTYSAEWAKNQPNWAKDRKVFLKTCKNRSEAPSVLLQFGDYRIEKISKRERDDQQHAYHLTELGKLYEATCGRKCQNLEKLFRALRKLENKVSRIMENYCNADIEIDSVEKSVSEARQKVRLLFGNKLPKNFGINWDPRGYALKLFPPTNERGLDTGEAASPFDLLRDWGGNQIIAPDFNS